jgi:hypothetical protein
VKAVFVELPAFEPKQRKTLKTMLRAELEARRKA